MDIFVVEGVQGQIFDLLNRVIVCQGWSFKRESVRLKAPHMVRGYRVERRFNAPMSDVTGIGSLA
jgi:hypothetical protein